MHGEMVQQESVPSSQFSVAAVWRVLDTGNRVPATAILLRKCVELPAGLPDFCCWSCSPRPSGRWRWPVLPSREPCTACASRYPATRRSPRCRAIMRWRIKVASQLRNPRKLVSSRRNCCLNQIAAAAQLPRSGRIPPQSALVLKSSDRTRARRRKARSCSQAISPDTIPPAPLLVAKPFAKS